MDTRIWQKGISFGLACTLLMATACGIGGDDSVEQTKDVAWKQGTYSAGITVTENLMETVIVCDGTAGGALSSAQTELSVHGVWQYYTMKVQATSSAVVQLRVNYHIGGGTVVEGTADCFVDVQPKTISVVMYNQAEVLDISLHPFANGAFTGAIVLTESYLSNSVSGTTVLHCDYDSSVPPPSSGTSSPSTSSPSTSSPNTSVIDPGADDPFGDSSSSSSDYVVNDDSPIPMQERLATAYNDYFKIGMTAGYERYDQYLPLEGHFNSFTCENEMKLYTIAPEENEDFNYKDISTYDFSKADEMLTYMRSKGKKIRGHALIWHYEAPSWILDCTDKATLLDMIDTYCYNVVKHFSDNFGDVIYAWDVVNEAVSDNYNGGKVEQAVKDVFGNIDDGCNEMRSSFYAVAGIDYVTTAFKAARRADPNVKLYYNDYNICTEKQKLRGVMNLVSKIIDAGAPIDGVGLQSHFKSTSSGVITEAENAIMYLQRLAEIKNHPLDIQITELDVENRGNNDTALATFYGSLFEMYRRHSNVISSVTFWGVADDYSWLDNGQYNMAYPFLFDKDMNKKPAFDSVFNF